MPIDFHAFQEILTAVMIGGLLVFLMPLVRITARARLPRLSVVLILVPVIGIVWLWVVALSMGRVGPTREEP